MSNISYGAFLRENARWLAAGALLSFLSSFGQTFFIAIFSGEIRETFGLSHGQWGGIYTLGTALSAAIMFFTGGLADKFRIRTIAVVVIASLAAACFAMALNPSVVLLPLIILALRYFGQGMSHHAAYVAMARWFVATRGRALAVATIGFSLSEATMPLFFVWLKTFFSWQALWIGAGVFCLLMLPVFAILLRTERTPESIARESTSYGMDGRFWTRSQALRHPVFWAMVPALLFFPAFGTAFWFHQVHFAEVKGWDHLSLVAVFPLGTGAFALSTIAYGWAIDRFGSARLLPLYLLPLVLAFTAHWYAPSLAWSAVGVVLMGVAGGGQATLPAACWAEFFGTRFIGSIKAAVAAVMVLGSAIGPGLTGWLIDVGFAFPTQLLFFAGSFALASAVLVVPIRNAQKRLAVSS